MSETTENVTTADETPTELPGYKSALLEDLEEAMRDVVDPELGVNVVAASRALIWKAISSTWASCTASTSTSPTSRSST